MRTALAFFTLGLIVLVGGVVLALFVPPPVIVEWETKSKFLAKQEILHFEYYWINKTSYASPSLSSFSFDEEAKDFVVKGEAREIHNNLFNFYILDGHNQLMWVEGNPYESIFEAEKVSQTTFAVPINPHAYSYLFFGVENPQPDINVTVKLTAYLEYKEKTTVASAQYTILGGVIASLGLAVIIVSAILVRVRRTTV